MNLVTKNAPFYTQARVGTLVALHKSLGIPLAKLLDVAKRADTLYRVAQSIPKSDGTVRVTYDAHKELKNIHRKIKNNILDKVNYPAYLTGSLRNCDYKVNASFHVGSKIVISEDISAFFPSISASHVYSIWSGFFGFSDEVANCLTQLTTRHGVVPQGAITSSFLANLVFWKDEANLYESLATKGMTYSRYVDDIAVSSKFSLSDKEKTDVISDVYGMLFKNGFKPKRSKHEITTSDKRMAVTKLSVNTKPGLKKSQRSNIRAAVHNLKKRVESGETISFDSGDFAKIKGRIIHLGRFHPGEAKKLEQCLEALQALSVMKTA